MFTKEYLLPNQEMCLGIEGTFETADSERELKSEYLHICGKFHYRTIISDPKIPLHINS